MTIKPVSRSDIESALKIFDQELRGSPEFDGWENSKAQRHAILFEGRRYPPKKIISLATAMPVSAFRGGPESNNYLVSRAFEIVPLDSIVGVAPPDSIIATSLDSMITKQIPSFQIGKKYDRKRDIHDRFGGNEQSGISASSNVDAIFLFTGESGEQYGYTDGPSLDEAGTPVFLYTGEGQSGDMKVTRGNRAIAEHSKDGRALHMFRSFGKGRGYAYMGEFVYAGHSWKQGVGKDGLSREVLSFRLVSVADAEAIENAAGMGDEEAGSKSLTLEEARDLAIAASSSGSGLDGKTAARMLYRRSKAVKDYVLMRAKGKCESCNANAPFNRINGEPYLEPHHTTRVSDGGPDHPSHVAAICPTCHREIHYGSGGAKKNARLQAYLKSVEPA